MQCRHIKQLVPKVAFMNNYGAEIVIMHDKQMCYCKE